MCRFISDLNLASWISKTSSLLFLKHVDADNSQFRLALLSNDGSTSERDSHQEEIKSEATGDIKRSHNLTSSQKRALIIKRLIPLVISLMILGGAVAVRFLIPLPSSHETSSFGNDTRTANTSYNNLTTNLVTWTTRDRCVTVAIGTVCFNKLVLVLNGTIVDETRYKSRMPWFFFFFFRLLLSNCLNWKIYCDDHSLLSLFIV